MTTRIIFNGQEYAGTEAMPEAVRTAYQEALAQQSSITINGREFKDVTNLPNLGTVARALLPREHSDDFLRAHHRAKQAMARMLPFLLGLTAAGVMAGGWLVWHLHASLRSQGAEFQVDPGLLVAVALTSVLGICIAIAIMRKKQESTEADAPECSASDAQTTPSPAQNNKDVLRALDTTEHTLARALQILLAVAAGGVVAGGVWMISQMDASSRSQAGHIFVGIGMLIAVACIVGGYVSIEMRLKK